MGFIRDEVDSQIGSVVYTLEQCFDKIKKYISNFYIMVLRIFLSGIVLKLVLILLFNIKLKYLEVFTPRMFFYIMIILSVVVLILFISNFVFFICKIINTVKNMEEYNEDLQTEFSIKNLINGKYIKEIKKTIKYIPRNSLPQHKKINIKKLFNGNLMKNIDNKIENFVRKMANDKYYENVSGIKRGVHSFFSLFGATSHEDIINIADNRISPVLKKIYRPVLFYGLAIPLIIFLIIPLIYFILSFVLSYSKTNVSIALGIVYDIIIFIILWKNLKCQTHHKEKH